MKRAPVVNARDALAFIEEHGVVLMAARGPVPSLAEAIAGGPIRGSWWGHPKAHQMFAIFETVSDSKSVLVCRLTGGKVTFVHRRLWPALARLAGRLPKSGLAAIREEHTASGRHRTVATPFARWVPRQVLDRARRMSETDAVAQCGAGVALRPRRPAREGG
ncbi:MAG TPA: hypothetical protein VFB49_11040 [Patescibacteria group bacterium]|nr:hypothetical protein [Patescibacteria group bacterium]